MAYPPPPYKDAVCGVPVCGEAICGTWWAYPARARLNLNGRAVTLGGFSGVYVSVGRGALSLQGRSVGLAIAPTIPIGRGTLTLAGRQTVLKYSSTFVPQRGLLRLVGSNVDFVGQEFLFPIDCGDDTLAGAPCTDDTLVGASCTDDTLSTASSSDDTLVPALEQELVMASLDCR